MHSEWENIYQNCKDIMSPEVKYMALDSIHLVFLGCGKVTAKHAKTLSNFKEVKLSFASRDEAKSKDYSKKFKGAGYFGSYSLAIQSDEINVVFIATPPFFHLELTLAALRAGKHVIIEKPPFFNSTDFDIVDKLRSEKNLQVMVAENYFYKPLLQKLRSIIKSPWIGDIKFMFFNASKSQEVTDWRNEKLMAGGGALFEGGIHWINFISNLGLNVKSITGFQPAKSSDAKMMERSMQVVVKYEEGMIGTLLYSWEIKGLFKGLRLSRIYGTAGSITFESNGLFIFIRGKKWKLIFPGLSDISGTKKMFGDFFYALKNGCEPAFSFSCAKEDIVLIEEAYKTALAG